MKVNEPTIDNLDIEFVRSVDELCRQLFVDNVTVRESDGERWTSETVKSAFQSFATAYDNKEITDPGTHLELAAKNATHSAHRVVILSYME